MALDIDNQRENLSSIEKFFDAEEDLKSQQLKDLEGFEE